MAEDNEPGEVGGRRRGDEHSGRWRDRLIQRGSRISRFVRDKIVEARWFQTFMAATAVLNAVALWPMTDAARLSGPQLDDGDIAYAVLEDIFLAIWCVEFLLKVTLSPFGYWRNFKNCFDAFVLAVSVARVVMCQILRRPLFILYVLHTLRAFSIIRVGRYIYNSQVLLSAFVQTLTEWMPSVIVLTAILFYLAAVIGIHIFGKEDPSEWGTFGRAFTSIASIFSCDGWTDLEMNMEERVSVTAARTYTAVIILIGKFVISNVVVSVVLFNIEAAYKKSEEAARQLKERMLLHKKERLLMRQRVELEQLTERQNQGKFANFQEMLAEFRASLRHDDIVIPEDLSTNVLWLETFVQTMNKTEPTLFSVRQLHNETANNLIRVHQLKMKRMGSSANDATAAAADADT